VLRLPPHIRAAGRANTATVRPKAGRMYESFIVSVLEVATNLANNNKSTEAKRVCAQRDPGASEVVCSYG